ncbi:MAG: O-antigen ligase family protein [Bacteroidales bacterium]|nr:O-antigen ligase family protein [Bacteroidales bacterium]
MMISKTNLFYIGFAILILLIVNNIRSGVLVDTSFSPRFFLLPVSLLITTLLLFRKKISFKITLYEITCLLFYLWSLLSSLWATVPSESIVQSQLIFVSFSVYVIVKILQVRNSRFEQIFITVLLMAMMFSFFLAFYKMAGLEFFDPYRINSVSANNNLYAGYLLISLPLTFAGYSIFRGFRKYLSAAVGMMALFFIIILQSRAVYVGLLFAMILSFLLLVTRYRSVLNRKNILVGSIFLILLLAGVSSFYSSLDQPRKNYFLSKIPVWQYFRSYDDSLHDMLEKKRREKAELTGIPEFDFAGSYYENANLRIIFWKRSACLFASHPVLGTGAGNWRIMVPSCPKPDNPDHTLKNYTYSQPHNEWIGFVTELGIPGFLFVFVIFFLPVIIVLWQILIRRESLPVTSMFYAAFLAGFYLFACFDFPFRRVEHNVMVFSVLAFLMARISLNGWSFTGDGLSWKYLRILLFAGLAFTSVVAIERIKGEFYTRIMFRNEGKNQEKVIVNGQAANNRFYRLTPNTLPLDWFVGVAQFNLGDEASARASFLKALMITPFEVRVLNDHATALYSLGKIEEAKAELQRALAIDPFFEDAGFNLAAIYYYKGERDSALFYVNRCRKSQKKADFLDEIERLPVIRSEDRN